MRMQLATMAATTLLVACSSNPPKDAWLMQDGHPWVAMDGGCIGMRPLKPDEKSGFCYDVMTDSYQHKHHYEPLNQDEFASLYPQVQATLTPAPELPAGLATSISPILPDSIMPILHIERIYTALPFHFNKAHLSKMNRKAISLALQTWKQQGLQVLSVSVTGHTDAIGTEHYNDQLSVWRAESVAYYLKRLGIPQTDIRFEGAGMRAPKPDARRQADNRYVDLKFWLARPEEKVASS